MGEQNVELIEQNVKNNTEDIRDLKKWRFNVDREMNDLKTNQEITKNGLQTLNDSVGDLKKDVKDLRQELRDDKDEQLDRMQDFAWKFGSGLAVTIIGGVVTAILLI
ncbi:hypothetical protein GCM10007063_05450 [Lentibacillus kapialis]|uniref:DUF1640 domain-containing protein n=1 Tax=Lentibacillus kapialis TaxID=340214 RepID=A0A917UU17_9BACI|nr:hypothetical protein [Lentibacillus kapialis]GGJ85901.1 hypothetical protein GCM10007063_05450 [Lentibacillus kapialis]